MCTGNTKLLWAFCNDGWVYWERVTLTGILELWLGVLEKSCYGDSVTNFGCTVNVS